MAITGTIFGYENFELEREMTDILNTKLDTKSLMTIDESLTEKDGLKKIVNKYTYNGVVEKLGKGEANTQIGTVTFTTKEYAVNRYQQKFTLNDVDVMNDSYLLDTAIEGASKTMTNEINDEYFNEIAKISNVVEYNTFDYDAVVDALAVIGCEAEENTFIIMGSDLKAQVRKDEDYVSSKQGEILYTGQFGTMAGIPVLFSKKVPSGVAYITKKDAVKFFVKKEGRVETSHNIDTKDNDVVYDRFGVIALVDDTESVRLEKSLSELTVKLTKGTGKVTLAQQTSANGYKFFYLASDEEIARTYTDTDRTDWIEYNADVDIPVTGTKYVAVIKVKEKDNTVVAFGQANETV